jgi:hypothetical protein
MGETSENRKRKQSRRLWVLLSIAVGITIGAAMVVSGTAAFASFAPAHTTPTQTHLGKDCVPCGVGGCWIKTPPPGHCSQGVSRIQLGL